jgi:hypothetical protein
MHENKRNIQEKIDELGRVLVAREFLQRQMDLCDETIMRELWSISMSDMFNWLNSNGYVGIQNSTIMRELEKQAKVSDE